MPRVSKIKAEREKERQRRIERANEIKMMQDLKKAVENIIGRQVEKYIAIEYDEEPEEKPEEEEQEEEEQEEEPEEEEQEEEEPKKVRSVKLIVLDG